MTGYNVTGYNVTDYNVTGYDVTDYNVTDYNVTGYNVTDYSDIYLSKYSIQMRTRRQSQEKGKGPNRKPLSV